MARNRRVRLVSVTALAALSLALVGCGGNDSESSAPQDATEKTTTENESTERTETDSTTTAEAAGAETGQSITGTLPPAGQATVDVDGKTFVFLASDTLSERLFQCEVTDGVVTLNFQTDGHDLAVQVRKQDSDEWLGPITVAPMQVEGKYVSTPNEGGEFVIDGKSMVYTGRFDFSPQSDPVDFQDVGEGQIAVTCP